MISRFVFNEAFDISVILFYDYGPLNNLVSGEIISSFFCPFMCSIRIENNIWKRLSN